MKHISIGPVTSVLVLVLGSCAGGGKQEIPLANGQSYQLQPSGKMTVFPAGSADAPPVTQPIQKLRVKLKNERPDAKSPGCWRCSDCICNAQDCSCTECTSC